MVWLVAAKATFDIGENGEVTVSDEQQPVYSTPVYRDNDNPSSLIYESDLVPKEKTDLLLNATAYTPNDGRVNQIDVGITLGKWRKILRVYGKRRWFRTLGVLSKTDALNFDKIPVIYENAYGGKDAGAKPDPLAFEKRNPVGFGYVKKVSSLTGHLVPNIEFSDAPTRKKPKKNRVAGFGPIPVDWEPRIKHAGTCDEEWKNSRFPLLPLDFNPDFYQCAPEDQILNDVLGGETVELKNLTTPIPFLQFTLPKIEIYFHTLMDDAYTDHVGKLQTIIIEPDASRLIMVWLSKLNCKHQGKTIEFTDITHKKINTLQRSVS